MPIGDSTRGMIAKLIGMLGTDNDNERATAAAFLRRKLMGEGVSFGDLAALIRDGGGGHVIERVVYRDRDVYPERSRRDEGRDTTASVELAQKIMARAGANRVRIGGLDYRDWRFLKDIIRTAELTGGCYRLTDAQAEWMTRLESRWCGPRSARFYRTKRPGPIPEAMFDDCGLGDPAAPSQTYTPPPQEKPAPVPDDILDDIGLGTAPETDLEDHIGAFRSRMAGERKYKTKPNPQTVPGDLPPEDYHGDFLEDEDLTARSRRAKRRFDRSV